MFISFNESAFIYTQKFTRVWLQIVCGTYSNWTYGFPYPAWMWNVMMRVPVVGLYLLSSLDCLAWSQSSQGFGDSLVFQKNCWFQSQPKGKRGLLSSPLSKCSSQSYQDIVDRLVFLNKSLFYNISKALFILLNVPHVSASASKYTTLRIFLISVWIGPFLLGKGLIIWGRGKSLG